MCKKNLTSTNKATFKTIGYGDRIILRKKYFRVGNAASDFLLLSKIKENFETQEIDNFAYRALEVYDYDCGQNHIDMEFFSGESIGDHYILSKDPAVFYLMGVWLALLHIQTSINEGKVISFNDFNRTNVLIDFKKKSVVALDPGNYVSFYEDPGISALMGLFSATRGALKEKFIHYFKSMFFFLKGYVGACGNFKLSSSNWLCGAHYINKRLMSGSSKSLKFRLGFVRFFVIKLEVISLLVLAYLIYQALFYFKKVHPKVFNLFNK